jgi:hypothetical protein
VQVRRCPGSITLTVGGGAVLKQTVFGLRAGQKGPAAPACALFPEAASNTSRTRTVWTAPSNVALYIAPDADRLSYRVSTTLATVVRQSYAVPEFLIATFSDAVPRGVAAVMS